MRCLVLLSPMLSYRHTKAAAAAVIIGCSVIAAILIFFGHTEEQSSSSDDARHVRRRLSTPPQNELQNEIPQYQRGLYSHGGGYSDEQVQESEARMVQENNAQTSIIYPWARDLLIPLTDIHMPNPEGETAIFWHVPKSGGTTAKNFYKCLHLSIDIASHPVTILDNERKRFVQAGMVDVLFSSMPDLAVQNLFSSRHKGRAMALFRPPVDRLFSKFFYLQIADWERTYRPEWKGMDPLDWVNNENSDNNHMVKKLAGKVQKNTATEDDLILAMNTIRERFVVGLMHEMEESIRRFSRVIGIDESEGLSRSCMYQYFGQKDGETKKMNSHSHPKVEKGSPAWELLAEQNALDIRLYDYVLELFEEQRELVNLYPSKSTVVVQSKENGWQPPDYIPTSQSDQTFQQFVVKGHNEAGVKSHDEVHFPS